MDLGAGLGHLSYSTLVHPADNWTQLWDSITRYLPAVKERVSPDKPFAVSLRLANRTVEELTAGPAERAKLKAFFDDRDMYVYTANAFPYGPFKGEPVKAQVYEPDWRTDERAEYTMKVADILAEVAPPGVAPSIQTPPLGFKPRVTGPDVVQAYTNQVIRVVAHLVGLERRTGRTVTLAIEPEPACFLELTTETIDYFTNHLYAPAAVKDLAAKTGLSVVEAERTLRRQFGTVYDVCHQAVEFEDVAQSMNDLGKAGIPILKFQIASALRIPDVDPEKAAALKAFDDPVYFHQTIEKLNGALTHYLDIPNALAAYGGEDDGREWRTHFHVPVFLEDVGVFKTTRPDIEAALRYHKANPVSDQVEIETYTWDVLPEEFKTGDIVDYVVRELEWVRTGLTGSKAT
ncbi:MAG: metabolite traffic protein EboE [Hyphomicrobiales bacterium]|nr:metabolite traffic protein EboE [Hyphomicrobiales bacterium]